MRITRKMLADAKFMISFLGVELNQARNRKDDFAIADITRKLEKEKNKLRILEERWLARS